jgi:TonB family protein
LSGTRQASASWAAGVRQRGQVHRATLAFLVVLSTFASADDEKDLLKAAWVGDEASIERLLGKGTDANALGDRDVTALILAAHQGHAGVVQRLLAAGADVDARSEDGTSAVSVAARQGHIEAVRALVDAGAAIFATDFGGKPPIVRASDNGHTDVVELLEQAGAGRVPPTREQPELPQLPEGTKITPPEKIADAAPTYPDVARWARDEGLVVLEAIIEKDGRVHPSVRVVRSVPSLDQAAIDAVRRWRFSPPRVNGEAIPMKMTVRINFSL